MLRVKGIQGTVNTDTSEPITVVTRLELQPNAFQMNDQIIPFPAAERRLMYTLTEILPSKGSTGGQSGVILPKAVIGGGYLVVETWAQAADALQPRPE